MKQTDNIFGKNVRFYREKLGMTQTELAQLVGYSTRGAIHLIEDGERDIPTPLIPVFANALHVSINDLIGQTNASREVVYAEYMEFLPYLASAEKWQLKAIREILHMPEVEKKEQLSNCI